MKVEKEFFTENGVQQVKDQYYDSYQKEFIFSKDDPTIKANLILMSEQPTGYGDKAFNILFIGSNGFSLPIKDFMDLNKDKVSYRFENFSRVIINEYI